MENNTEKKSINGVTSWNVNTSFNSRVPFDQEALPRIPFMKLQDGKNLMRVVSPPAKFFQVRVKLPLSKSHYGDRIRTYTHERIEELNNKRPSERYYAIVIDRRDQQLKLLDMSSVIQEQIAAIKDEKNQDRDSNDVEVTPRDFDINITRNSKAPPAKFYMVTARDNKTLSAADLELINTLGDEMMLKILNNSTRAPKKETFFKNLEKLGWYPGFVLEEEKDEAADGSHKLSAPKEDDFNFDRKAE
jgi:hypothetical protein